MIGFGRGQEVSCMKPFASLRNILLGLLACAGILALGLHLTGGALASALLPGPDLIIQSIQLTPANPLPGQSVSVEVRVGNVGSSAAGGFTTFM